MFTNGISRIICNFCIIIDNMHWMSKSTQNQMHKNVSYSKKLSTCLDINVSDALSFSTWNTSNIQQTSYILCTFCMYSVKYYICLACIILGTRYHQAVLECVFVQLPVVCGWWDSNSILTMTKLWSWISSRILTMTNSYFAGVCTLT